MPCAHPMTREESPRERSIDELASTLYATLRTLADRVRGAGPMGQALRPTDLVHECYVRLAQNPDYRVMERSDFLALAARVIRNLLVDRARREGQRHPTRITGAGLASVTPAPDVDLLALDDALRRLATRDERQARIVELKFFGGLTGEEIARALGVARRTITKEWQMARAWLRRELEK